MADEPDNAHSLWQEPVDKLDKLIRRRRAQSPKGDGHRELNRLSQKRARLGNALERLECHYPDLYRGDEGIERSAQEVERLITDVCQGSGGYELRDIQHYLVVGLAKGVKELGWSLPVPTPLVVSGVESSSATPETFQYLEHYDRLDAAFFNQLQTAPTSEYSDQRQDAGELLFSLCMHSGLISMKWLAAVPDAILAGAGVRQNVAWLELEPISQRVDSEGVKFRRRVFLAPVSQMLVWRWYQRWGRTWPKERSSSSSIAIDVLFRDYLTKLRLANGLKTIVAGQCLRLAEANLTTQLPDFLVHYLRSNRIGASLVGENWERLLSDLRGSASRGAKQAEGGRLAHINPLGISTHFPDQRALFRELIQGIDVKLRREAKEFLKSFLQRQQVSPILYLMTSWAKELLTNGGLIKKNLSNSSVVRYLNWIKGLLFYADELRDPLNADEDDWQAIYDEIIANAPGRIADCAGRLAAFHQFLTQSYGLPDVDIEGVNVEHMVDAHVLTPREYQRAREVLQQRALDNGLAECQEIILILGFRLGLRRGEAYSRLFSDFAGLEDPKISRPELLVRPNKHARIKSETSTRRLPLDVLLTPDELLRLRHFHKQRRSLVSGQATVRPIFAETAGNYWPAVTSSLFDPLTQLLQEVTGDCNFRFHHLRHSFVTFTLLRLMETSPGGFFRPEWQRSECGIDLLPSSHKCLWEQANLPDPGQALWLIAMWAGHASPQVTLECYSHLLDWLVGRYLQERHNPDLSLDSQRSLLGKSPLALEKLRNRQSLSRAPTPAGEIAQMLADRWPKRGRKPLYSLKPHTIAQEHYQAATPKFDWMAAYNLQRWAAEDVVKKGEARVRGLNAAAQLLGLTYEQARRWDRISRTYYPNLSRQSKDVLRNLNEKHIHKGLPEINGRFIAPPSSESRQSFARHCFLQLIKWHEEEPVQSLKSMQAVLENSQRSKTPITPLKAEHKGLLYKLLVQLKLKKHVQLQLRLKPGMSPIEKKRHWAKKLGVLPDEIICKSTAPDAPMRKNGSLSIKVSPPRQLNEGQNLFWSVFRFAVISAYTVCKGSYADEELDVK